MQSAHLHGSIIAGSLVFKSIFNILLNAEVRKRNDNTAAFYSNSTKHIIFRENGGKAGG